MKKHLLVLAAAMTMAAGVNAQNFSTLNWNREISESEFNAAYSALDESNLFGTSISAQYALRGGKENTTPQPHSYQFQWSLHLDNYAGYFVVSHYDYPYSDNAIFPSTYALCERFNGGPRGTYTAVKNCFDKLLLSKDVNSLPELKAVNLLYYCIAAQEMADISGPFTYEEDKQGVEEPKTYNDLKTIYYGIKADLDNIVACLKNYPNRPAWYKNKLNEQFNGYDTARDGIKGEKFTEACWRLANSIKLRMAMHIVKVEPKTARAWAEEAVKSGVIESEDMQSGLFPSRTGFTNPLPQICNTWNDNRLNASFETLMMAFDHPYSKFLFETNVDDIENKKTGDILDAFSQIIGIRAGAHVGEGQTTATNQYCAASSFEGVVGFMGTAPLYLAKWSEVDFLRAEGAIRGWNMGGKAQDFYERAIRNACLDEPKERKYYAEDGVDCYDNYVEDYLKLEAAKPYTQVDAFGDGEDWVSPITIGVKWNDADNLETKLEKIITQKWFALFPQSGEAWTEVRRTGYPRLIPVMNVGDGDGSLKEGDMIRRMPWLPTDEVGQKNVRESGVPALGGPDQQATRLWWDVDTKGDNFTPVADIKADVQGANEFYDLSGRKVGSLKSGLYIINGKKVVVK